MFFPKNTFSGNHCHGWAGSSCIQSAGPICFHDPGFSALWSLPVSRMSSADVQLAEDSGGDRFFFSVIHHWGEKFGCLRGSFFQFCVMKKRSLLGERGTRFSLVDFFDGKLDLQVPPADRRLDMFAGCPSLVMHGGKSGLSSESITVMFWGEVKQVKYVVLSVLHSSSTPRTCTYILYH